MALIELNVSPAVRKAAVTIGNFDGVHRGHQAMVAKLKSMAAEVAAPAVVVTFDPHPVRVLRPDFDLPRLTSLERRRSLLLRYGADEVIVLPTDTGLLQMEAEEFFRQVVMQQLQAKALVEGPDFHFGRDRAGNARLLEVLCREAGVRLQILQAVSDADQMVSSTRIRRMLLEGNVADANRLLGHRYQLSGRIVRGAGRGRSIGFPTANLQPSDLLIPADGVYAGATELQGRRFPAAVHIGPNPTFAEARRKIECHVVGYEGDLYEQELSVELTARLRPLSRFDDEQALRRAISSDVQQCVSLLADG